MWEQSCLTSLVYCCATTCRLALANTSCSAVRPCSLSRRGTKYRCSKASTVSAGWACICIAAAHQTRPSKRCRRRPKAESALAYPEGLKHPCRTPGHPEVRETGTECTGAKLRALGTLIQVPHLGDGHLLVKGVAREGDDLQPVQQGRWHL